jgi:hypothetical protein
MGYGREQPDAVAGSFARGSSDVIWEGANLEAGVHGAGRPQSAVKVEVKLESEAETASCNRNSTGHGLSRATPIDLDLK